MSQTLRDTSMTRIFRCGTWVETDDRPDLVRSPEGVKRATSPVGKNHAAMPHTWIHQQRQIFAFTNDKNSKFYTCDRVHQLQNRRVATRRMVYSKHTKRRWRHTAETGLYSLELELQSESKPTTIETPQSMGSRRGGCGSGLWWSRSECACVGRRF